MKKVFLTCTTILALMVTACTGGGHEEGYDHAGADIVITSANLVAMTGPVNLDGDLINAEGADNWAAFNMTVKEAGRYETAVRVKGEGSIWIEDYFSNPDGRTYNITGAMQAAGTDFVVLMKDGSPLNTGEHDMKIHMTGNVSVESIMFTKMIDHQDTPELLTQSVEGNNWALVWSDEFEGNGAPDATKWTYDVGNWGWGNNEPQYYTDDRRENARLEDGNLIIEARKNDMGQEWTSARLTTRGKVSFLYGKIEFRAKAPSKDGTWAAGWLLGDDYVDELSWPYCGEIDVLECVGSEIDDETGNGINHASCHTRTYYFKEGTHITAVTDVEDMTNTFHTYTIEWTPKGIEAFLGGEHYYTYDKTGDELEWPFAKPQNLIVNLAMGGGMGGNIDPTIESQQFILDYVRVYELEN